MTDTPIDYLISRRSIKLVQAPGPTEAHLDLILRAAMSAPDHGRLRPWRFALIRDEAVSRLGEIAISTSKRAGLESTPQKEASTRNWLAKAPLMIAVACRMDAANTRIPENERMLATGAAVINMLNAAHMLGYGAYWSTGLGTYVDEVNAALGFDPQEYRFMGYVSIGTPIRVTEAPERPNYEDFVHEWSGL